MIYLNTIKHKTYMLTNKRIYKLHF